MNQAVIQIEDLSKEYMLGVIGHDTLYRDLQSWWARVRGKQDPNALIYDDFRKHGARFWALRGIAFDVQEGDRIGIIGKNGAGKSTLLKILSRVTIPTSGRVKMRGRTASLLEVGTGFHGELTGRENIYLNGAILGMTRSEIDAKFDEIVDFSGVEDFIDTPVKRYSSGMHVRLGFAVAAHLEPDILIVDEVLAVGDAEFQRKCISKMDDISVSEGRTILFVSHNMESVRKLCNRGILLEDGLLKLNGPIEQVVDEYLGSMLNLEPDIVWHIKGQPIKIASIKVSSYAGPETSTFKPEDGMRIQLTLESEVDIRSPQVYLHVMHGEQEVLYANNLIDGTQLEINKGINNIECGFKHLPLRPSNYKLMLVIRDQLSMHIVFGVSTIGTFAVAGEDRDYGLSSLLNHGYGSYAAFVPYFWNIRGREREFRI